MAIEQENASHDGDDVGENASTQSAVSATDCKTDSGHATANAKPFRSDVRGLRWLRMNGGLSRREVEQTQRKQRVGGRWWLSGVLDR